MLNLEFKERERQLRKMRNLVPDVPVLAKKIKELKDHFDKEKQIVSTLS